MESQLPTVMNIGATPVAGGVFFRVWAPAATCVAVEVVAAPGRTLLERDGEYYQGVVPAAAGDSYWYWLDDTVRRPDPASRCQPAGVHGPSQVINPDFPWSDGDWPGITLAAAIFYELHIGTFTPAGTFDAAIEHLAYLRELGVTALQLMPVAQFPGERNWGYDGVYPFAPQLSYGGVAGLKRFVDACHCQGLAVFLDVVYNHLGPEGNYLHAFGPYFTDRYRTPWGDAVNFDGPDSDGVRHYFIANAGYWLREYHFDGLRLDAVHGIFDFSARHILAVLAGAVHDLAVKLGRPAYVIAESDLNDPRLVEVSGQGGYGLDAQWSDDFHHALHTVLTGERDGYYRDFGDFPQLVTALRDGFVYAGDYSPFRRRRHGRSSAHLPPQRLVVCIQNHDQIGNRPQGDRLTAQISPQQLRLATATLLLSPYLPLLFMGEEYGETAPFPYFTDHGDPALVAAVHQGRREEFAAFIWSGAIPVPQDEGTFTSARINPALREQDGHRQLFAFTRELIRLRKSLPPVTSRFGEELLVDALLKEQVLLLRRRSAGVESLCVLNFNAQEQEIPPPFASGALQLQLDANDRRWGGTGQSDRAVKEPAMLRLSPWGVLLFSGERVEREKKDV